MKIKNLNACYTVYVPDSKFYNAAVVGAMEAVNKAAGGSTMSEAAGAWGEQVERVTIISYWFAPGGGEVNAAVSKLAQTLLECGEQAVSVVYESYNTRRRMQIYTKE